MRTTGSGGDFWGLLSEAERLSLSTIGRSTVFRPGDTMCVEGEPTTHLFVIIAGWVKVISVTTDGHEVLLALRGPGDTIGELASESSGYRTATVQALSLVRSLIVGHERFIAFLDSHSGADRAYRRVMTRRWGDAATMLRTLSTSNGSQRLAGLLLDLADRHGTSEGNGISIVIPLSQEEIASLIGVSRATVTRALGNWRRRRLIGTGRRRFVILDSAGLRRIAGR